MKPPLGYVWRKYEVGVPLYDYTPDALSPGYKDLVIWHSLPSSCHPSLNRWEGLDEAFMGFISRGLDAPHACAYEAEKAIEIISREHLAKTWIPGADAAEAYGHVLSNFLGVWFGQRTPYFVHNSQNFLEIVRKLSI